MLPLGLVGPDALAHPLLHFLVIRSREPFAEGYVNACWWGRTALGSPSPVSYTHLRAHETSAHL
eukprot:8959238-Alexandrium_andersonii.AAC.1